MTQPQHQPLILTLQLDPSAQDAYDALRRLHFPPERNLIPAHLTLFHHLPDTDATHHSVRDLAAATPPLQLTGSALRSLGRGVAVFFAPAPLAALHAALAAAFHDYLIPQDRQPFRPHIVLQNKVTPETAHATLAQLTPTHFPNPQGIGLTLWRYLGGPWEHLYDLPFEG